MILAEVVDRARLLCADTACFSFWNWQSVKEYSVGRTLIEVLGSYTGIQAMKFSRCVCSYLVAFASIGVVFPQLAFAANGNRTASESPVKVQTRDVVLDADGTLRGQVVNRNGVAQAAMPVVLSQRGRAVAAARTDHAGKFKLAQLRGGVYQLHTTGGVGNYRVWANRTAPPSALSQVLLTHDESVALGQHRRGGVKGLLTNPWVIGGVVATAIAVPVAIHNSDSDSGS